MIGRGCSAGVQAAGLAVESSPIADGGRLQGDPTAELAPEALARPPTPGLPPTGSGQHLHGQRVEGVAVAGVQHERHHVRHGLGHAQEVVQPRAMIAHVVVELLGVGQLQVVATAAANLVACSAGMAQQLAKNAAWSSHVVVELLGVGQLQVVGHRGGEPRGVLRGYGAAVGEERGVVVGPRLGPVAVVVALAIAAGSLDGGLSELLVALHDRRHGGA
eukprot:CAMPEP_0198443364 /NCGR_PEP_ID=MMETSP1452-20131203/70058_1 /TAXON_ID=1181717 /ORGANISM="Synchroma pusillum, Strain CCMP3072" /LENGTH=217 /DNA_ID=CAMNT_0044163997 /DNA_START=122 /DNA_END=778 /DNA_ORIENTATION=+